MNITPIRTEQDYKQALKAIEPLFDREEELTGEEVDYFDVMISLIENYESKHYHIELPDPIEAIKFRMEQQGLEIKDLDGIIGKPNRVYEIFNKTRPLTLNMIRQLHSKLGIGADILIQA
ncbi:MULTISPECIES: type II toxin-antitoxin system HigA family antitoxin [Mannheimia]|uniref:Transcriptional regulator n=1 Tax=Mannheimia pernigra TaxID=111844 RepID=A0A7H8UT71_9PAST|nr:MULTISPECIES: transcriptional regulator [Mannheimia]QLB39722.1 transcriptional regulator [Mannheimia pernigra]QLB41785.1 transcriptional regulator [Mannheimia pernigra]QLB43899.1 transcriptional regulator [Mannheimia pernigra]QTM00989.1 transcriptional regulator [Mannheimia sp. ZY171111]